MSNYVDQVKTALDDFSRPGKSLTDALFAGEASPEDLGSAFRPVLGDSPPGHRPRDIQDSAARLVGLLEGLALGLKDALPKALLEFEARIVSELRGNHAAQHRAGLVIASDFGKFGRTEAGHFLADPAGSAWEAIRPRYNSGGSWLVLGWPRGASPRPVTRIEDVERYTVNLERERLNSLAEFQLEEKQRADAARIAWERSPEGQLAAMRERMARLEAENADLRSGKLASGIPK